MNCIRLPDNSEVNIIGYEKEEGGEGGWGEVKEVLVRVFLFLDGLLIYRRCHPFYYQLPSL